MSNILREMKTQINTLSLEEREELFRLIKADIDMVMFQSLF